MATKLNGPDTDGLTARQINELHAVAAKMHAENHYRKECGNAAGIPSLAGRDRDETNFTAGTVGMGIEAGTGEACETAEPWAAKRELLALVKM